MRELEIRFAQPTDAAVLSDISMEAKAYWQYSDEWLARWKEELTITPEYIKKHQVTTLRDTQRIIGFCTIEEHSRYYEVAHLWIRPSYMRQGLGQRLLADALSFILPRTEVRVVADPNAEAFYQKQGFITYDQVESEPPGRFLPLMRKVV